MRDIFGNCISHLRKLRGKSQKWLALEAGLDASYLAALERGRRSPPRDEILQRLMTALSVNGAERLEIQRALGLSRAVNAFHCMDVEYRQCLMQVATAMRFCTVRELQAIEVVVQNLRKNEGGDKMGP
jgi:transcriptional regulator with XRE-family HTH domain